LKLMIISTKMIFAFVFVPFCLPKKVPKKGPRRLIPPSGGKSPD
jgi:hypothetical protein